jgi:hypothetical protein
MSDVGDTWPLPAYDCGPIKHLHAIGVIANRFNSFERGMFDLYSMYTEKRFTRELSDFLFLALNERTRAEALTKVVHAFEKSRKALAFFDSLSSYFEWCWNARNQIIHSEFYPSMFGGSPHEISLTKRKSKKSAEPGYLKFTLPELRDIADKIEEGVKRCAAFRIWLRQRATPREKWPVSLKIHGLEPLPDKLVTPKFVTLGPNPIPPLPQYLHQSSRR